MKISTNEAIAAIYYALWQGGYEYASLERDAAHMAALKQFAGDAPHPFFAQTRQDTCEVYPFWPRAALLETASFHVAQGLLRDFEGLRCKIMSAPNVTDSERDERFWAWLTDFPLALQEVMYSDGFRRYFAWERAWCDALSIQRQAELAKIQRCIDVCCARYASPVQEIQLLISPIKCVYSADYHLVGETFVFSSGRLQVESVIHEFLHHVVHPVVRKYEALVLRDEREYAGLDASYYTAGRPYAFEEYTVRQLTALAMEACLPEDLPAYVASLLD